MPKLTSYKTLFIALLALIVFIAACGQGAGSASMPEMEVAEEPAADYAVGAPAEYGGEADFDRAANSIPAAEPPQQGSAGTEVQERLIIRTADLSIVVPDTEESISMISNLANSSGGWVVSSGTYQYTQAKQGNMTIRIPAGRFDAILQQIKDSATEVVSENISGQDVTEEYVDLSARLENLEATAARVRGFLDDTETVEEALAVNMELSRLEGDIEAMKGRLQYLSQSAAFSTINISITPDILNQPIEVAGWRPQGIARDAIEALVETLQVVASIGIWLALYLLPLFIIIVIPLYFLARWFMRRRKNRAAAA